MMEDSSKSVYEQRFDAAVKVIQNLPSNGSFQPSNEMMLKFYSYYKQATQGPCSIPRPGFWDPVGKVKWDAWHALGEMPKEEAMTAYVEDLKLIIESMPMTEEVEQLLQVLGPFYELVDEKKKINQVSDLTAGFDSMVLAPPKSVTKSIIRTMQINGTLDVRTPEAIEPPNIITMEIKERQHGGDGDGGDDTGSDDENEEEDEQVKKVATLKKKSLNGKAKGVSNGAVGDGMNPVTNGTQIAESVNGNHDDEEIDIIPNGSNHTSYEGEDLRGALHVASDSDSEVYCDSVDQFGAEENSESSARVILEDNSREEPPSSEGDAEILLGAQEGIQYGGEDGNTSGGGAQRHGLSTHRAGASQIRRGRGSRSVGSGSGFAGSLQGGGGDEERQGSDEARGGDLNEQIVTALARLQDDMHSVLERLHTLEALTASQARSVALSAEYLHPPANKNRKKPFWWPFDVSPATVAFALVWPFIAQWLIRLYFQRRRRKLH